MIFIRWNLYKFSKDRKIRAIERSSNQACAFVFKEQSRLNIEFSLVTSIVPLASGEKEKHRLRIVLTTRLDIEADQGSLPWTEFSVVRKFH